MWEETQYILWKHCQITPLLLLKQKKTIVPRLLQWSYARWAGSVEARWQSWSAGVSCSYRGCDARKCRQLYRRNFDRLRDLFLLSFCAHCALISYAHCCILDTLNEESWYVLHLSRLTISRLSRRQPCHIFLCWRHARIRLRLCRDALAIGSRLLVHFPDD